MGLVQITYTMPRRRTILHFSQIRLTDGRTFMVTDSFTALVQCTDSAIVDSAIVDLARLIINGLKQRAVLTNTFSDWANVYKFSHPSR